jgi:hypothetical protein
MGSRKEKKIKWAAAVCAAALGSLAWAQDAEAPKPAAHHGNRDALWTIAQCLADKPLAARPVSPLEACGTQVLAAQAPLASDSVVIEDRKMSKCPANAGAKQSQPESFGYVHALAMPLYKMTGVEQTERRPEGIWSLAWMTGVEYIKDTSELALVANPKAQDQFRSQDQLHIHIVKLKPGAKKDILESRGARRVEPTYVDSLVGIDAPVWKAAEENAAKLAAKLGMPAGLSSKAYGVAVVYDESRGKFAVVAVDESPERLFTQSCPGSAWKP